MGNCGACVVENREDSVSRSKESQSDHGAKGTKATTPTTSKKEEKVNEVKTEANSGSNGTEKEALTVKHTSVKKPQATDDNRASSELKPKPSNKKQFTFVPEDHVMSNTYSLFEVEKELGRGASCRVLRVSRKSDKKLMAMKEMRKDDRWNPMLFEQE
ncbi:hypothetical protein RFI_00617, partial [Reticulomyxa filosa]